MADGAAMTGSPDDAARQTGTTFTTDGVPATERFALWREEFSGLHDVDADRETRRDFRAFARQKPVGLIVVGEYRTPGRLVSRTQARCAQDGLDHWTLQFCIGGTLTTSDAPRRVAPGTAVLRTFARPYRDAWTAGEWTALILPRRISRTLDLRIEGLRGVVIEGGAVSLLNAMVTAIAGAPGEDGPRLGGTEAALLDVLGASMLECESGTIMASAPQSARRFHVESVIRDHLASARLSVSRVAALSGLSRSSLQRLFEHDGGVGRYIRDLRLHLVRGDLADSCKTHIPIAELARMRGMHCPSSFSHAFADAFGASPRAYRQAAATRFGSTEIEPPGPRAARLHEMLHHGV